MSRRIRAAVLGFAVAALLAGGFALATTLFPAPVVCPVCGEENSFLAVGSFGNYILDWPERFQLVFWPDTLGVNLWSCRRCRFTAFSQDFRTVPEDKKEELRKALADVHFSPPPVAGSAPANEYDLEYARLPIAERLAAAERVYTVLGANDAMWCLFHRIAGYLYEASGDAARARQSRAKAAELANAMLADPKEAGHAVELYLIRGSMRYFLGDRDAAAADLRTARTLTYSDAALSDERSRAYDAYLHSVIDDFLKEIEAGREVPRGNEPDDAQDDAHAD